MSSWRVWIINRLFHFGGSLSIQACARDSIGDCRENFLHSSADRVCPRTVCE